MVEVLSCSSCHVTFSGVDQLAEHSARQCECVASEVNGGQCSSPCADADDHAATAISTPACDVDDSSTRMKTTNVDDGDIQLDTAVDDLTEPRLLQSSSTQHSTFDADSDNDDEHFDASDNYVLQSQSAVQFDKVYAAESDAANTSRAGGDVVSGGVPSHSPKTSSSTLTNVSQLIDNNVSPASKIAMLESVVYALHQQQMFQLELIEALRRQLATALASSSSSSSRPDDDTSNTQTLDLTLPRSSETAVLDQGSSLSSLMRLSAGVDAHRAPPAVLHSPSTSPTPLLEGHDPAVTGAWQGDLVLNKSCIHAASLPPALLATPKHAPALNDLNLFKKGE